MIAGRDRGPRSSPAGLAVLIVCGASACHGTATPVTYRQEPGGALVVRVETNEGRDVVRARFGLDTGCAREGTRIAETQRFEYVVPELDPSDNAMRVFIADGCGHRERYACVGAVCFRESIDGP